MLTRRQGGHPRSVWRTCDELINIWLFSKVKNERDWRMKQEGFRGKNEMPG